MPDVLVYVEKRFDKKPMVNFENYHVTDWTTNDYNTRTGISKRTKYFSMAVGKLMGHFRTKKENIEKKAVKIKFKLGQIP